MKPTNQLLVRQLTVDMILICRRQKHLVHLIRQRKWKLFLSVVRSNVIPAKGISDEKEAKFVSSTNRSQYQLTTATSPSIAGIEAKHQLLATLCIDWKVQQRKWTAAEQNGIKQKFVSVEEAVEGI